MLPFVQTVFHGHQIGDAAASRNPHQFRHPLPIVGCLIRGGGRYQMGEEDLLLRAPTLSLLPAQVRDGNGLVGPYESFWCQFAWDGVRQASGKEAQVELPEGRFRRKFLRSLAASEMRGVLALFRRLQLWSRRPDPPSRLRASAALLELLAIWAQPFEPPAAQERSVVLYRNLIEQYADDPRHTLQAIAERVGLSAEHLSVLFRREMGVTPVAYRENVRIARARELLVSTNLPIAQVARQAGYPDANYFARAFRKLSGMTPRAFARRHSAQR